MKLREFFTNFFTRVKGGISRYFIVFFCTVIMFGAESYSILFHQPIGNIIGSISMTCILVGFLSVLLKSIQEYLASKLNNLIQIIVCAIAAIISFLLIYTNYHSKYMTMAYIGIMIALVCFIFFVLMRGDNRDAVFPKLISSSVFASAICTVLSIGISLCIGAFEALIFSWYNSYKLYLIINLLIWVVGFPNIFLSFVPKKDAPLPQSKIFKTFVLYAGLPLYILLIAILLVYLGKIVVTWKMPIGEINWFASFASLFFIFFVLSVMQYEKKLAKLFVKFGGYFLIPVLIMQAIAVFERVNAYGLTTPRTVSLVLILISILFIGTTIIKPKHLNKIALVSGIITLLVTVTPFNVIDMPVASQTAILKNALVKNDMLKDGSVIPNENVSNEDAKIIESAYFYLRYNANKVPEFIQDSDKSFAEIFGFELYQYEERFTYQHCAFKTKASVDITEYDRLVKVTDNNDMLNFEHNGQQYQINVNDIAQELYDQYGESQYELELYQVDENVSLYFSSFTVDTQNGLVYGAYINGVALIKN